jgi:hypothetical protein
MEMLNALRAQNKRITKEKKIFPKTKTITKQQ